MANPQKENGYTAIANEIMEALAKTKLPGGARRVLDVVLLKTYGWNKKEDCIALSQFVECTGMIKPRVCEALKSLEDMGIIERKGGSVANSYSLVKDFDQWRGYGKAYPPEGVRKNVIVVTEKRNDHYGKAYIQKQLLPKQLLQKQESTQIVTEKRTPPGDQARQFFDKTDFGETIAYLVSKGFPAEVAGRELSKFVSYWTERNRAGTKERWEMEKTFEVPRRLVTWFQRVGDRREAKGIIL